MIKLIIKFLLGILAMPVAAAATKAFYDNFINSAVSANLHYFVWGMVVYVILHLLFYRPAYLYVLGHEAVHAGMAWIFGGKIKSFKVSEEGGSVGTTKSNFVIELAPYFIPIYTIIITAVYYAVSHSYPIRGATFIFLIGFTLAFHMVSTIETLKVKQPDIIKSGYIFSITFVYIINIVIFALIFSMAFDGFSINKFFLDLWASSKYIYAALVKQLFF